MPRNFLPGSDLGLASFTAQLAGWLSARPGAFALDPVLVQRLVDEQSTYATALRRAHAPQTRGPACTAEKNQARSELTATTRQVAALLRVSPEIDDATLFALGLSPRKPKRRAVPTPKVAPALWLMPRPHRGSGVIELRLHNPAEPTRRGRPTDVTGAYLYAWVGPAGQPSATPPTDPQAWAGSFLGGTTKVRWFTQLPAALQPGTAVWFSACWINARKKTSPMAEPIKTIINHATAPQNGEAPNPYRRRPQTPSEPLAPFGVADRFGEPMPQAA